MDEHGTVESDFSVDCLDLKNIPIVSSVFASGIILIGQMRFTWLKQ